MEFDRSTQARSWIFDEQSLAECRRQAVKNIADTSSTRPRKFASGFRRRLATTSPSLPSFHDGRISPVLHHSNSRIYSLSTSEQETLVRFHAHQISTLVGPEALLPELRCSRTALSTAVALFRRFFLSNSVTEFPPRHIATAAAFLATKVEDCKVQIGILSHATAIVELKNKTDPWFRNELGRVSIEEIEMAEKQLMEGVNYEFRCHHPHNAIRVLASDFSTFLSEAIEHIHGGGNDNNAERSGGHSPLTTATACPDDFIFELHEEAVAITQAALIVSDAPFLFPPGQIAFAVVSMAVGGTDASGRLGADMRTYLSKRFAKRQPEDLLQFERQVSKIIRCLQTAFAGMVISSGLGGEADEIVALQTQELCHVLEKVAHIRSMRRQPSPVRCTGTTTERFVERKRRRTPEFVVATSPCEPICYKVPRVTPTRL